MIDIGSQVLGALARAAIDGTALAAITAVLCLTVLRRARPALIAALWTVVLIKFALPVAPALPVSLSGLVDSALAAAQSDPEVASGAAAALAGAMPAHAPAITGWQLAGAIGFALYAAIALTLIGRAVVRHRRTRAAAARLPLASGPIADALARAGAVFGLRRWPEARVTRAGTSPFLAGLWRPVIVVPEWLAGSPRALEAALVHELAHVVRRDLWVRALEIAVKSLFFFWPPVLWICRRLDEAREMACDEWACERQGIDRRSYARLLFAVAQRGHGEAPAGAVAWIRRSRLEARVDSLISRRSKPRLGVGLAVAVAAWALVGLAGGASDAAGDTAGDFECAIEPGVRDHILANYPEADRDGDGTLSNREVCAHQARMKRKLLDGVVDAELVSRVDPAADLDGDGVLGDWEIEWFKNQLEIDLGPGAGVVLHHRGSRQEVRPDRLHVGTASVAAPVCEPGKCVEDQSSGQAQLLIDVAFEPR